MKVVYTTEAIADLDSIFDYIANHYPAISDAFKIGFTQSLRASPDDQRVHRKFPTGRESCRIADPISIQSLYRVSGGTVEILHVHHAARE